MSPAMLRSTIVATVMLLTVAAPAPTRAADAPAPERTASGITGTWKGAVINQDGPAGYTGRVHIRRTADGYQATAHYQKLGNTWWGYRGHDHGWYRFREHLRGSTATPTVVRVRRDGARLLVRWVDPRSGYTGHMRARRL